LPEVESSDYDSEDFPKEDRNYQDLNSCLLKLNENRSPAYNIMKEEFGQSQPEADLPTSLRMYQALNAYESDWKQLSPII